MNPAAQRELIIWSAAVGIVVLVVWFVWLGPVDDAQDAKAVQLDELHADYEKYYEADLGADGMPVAAALATSAANVEAQRDELTAVEAEYLYKPGNDGAMIAEEFYQAETGRLFDFSAPITFNKAQSLVREVNGRLTAQARSLLVPFPDALPYEGKGAIQTGEDAASVATRGLQLAEVCCYASTLDLLFELFEFGDEYKAIERVQPGGRNRSYRSQEGSYATVVCDLSLICSYATVDRLMRRLADHPCGLTLEAIAIEQQEDLSQAVAFTVTLTIENNSAWELDPMPQYDVQAARGRRTSSAAGRGRRRR